MRSIRVSEEEWAAWNEAADAKGLSLIAWIRQILNRNARRK